VIALSPPSEVPGDQECVGVRLVGLALKGSACPCSCMVSAILGAGSTL
jgi:hypothetical protein